MKSTMIPTLPTRSRYVAPAETSETFRQPAYDCQELRDAMKLTVYVPGVEGSGVEIEGRGADLTVVARKAHFVRVNFHALALEKVQRDYRLRLRLGTGFDYSRMAAEITSGVLTVTLPKRARENAGPPLRRLA
ncbi:MAG: Hsp20/alpha crystallin family protein [Verrucomicrobia bacterium]|jgi:HSP20 family molecular chaperone IbpA|nr:Hsp20/alpha crystallin family protein [Verrucomicrobiota bacterium]